MSATYGLQRFVDAQEDAAIYARALEELRAGRKQSHWIWFVFPQIAGLGQSPMSQAYAIRSLEEARAYLAHPLLGPRLRECCEALLAADPAATADSILGGIDAIKVRSSMTLFARADPVRAALPSGARPLLRRRSPDSARPENGGSSSRPGAARRSPPSTPFPGASAARFQPLRPPRCPNGSRRSPRRRGPRWRRP